MPKIVDWDARRDEILSATWRVIARDGIARATIRAIAREADCSRGILAHYFDDKADILGSALLLSHRRVVARMDARAAGLTGLAALRVIMLEALPLDPSVTSRPRSRSASGAGRWATLRCASCSTRSSTGSPSGCAGISSRRRRAASSATAWTSTWPLISWSC